MSKQQAASKSDEIVVFEIVRDSACEECGEELGRGEFLRLERDKPLCLSCADLAHLTYLPRGDAALSRRAARYSARRVVVVRFSRTRGRYERQGLLVEEGALARAEGECLSDAAARARARERRAERLASIDLHYRAEFAVRLRERYPACSESESIVIADHACLKYSRRIGRSGKAKQFDKAAIDLAVRAHVRHAHTGYDGLLNAGWDRHEARAEVAHEVERIVAKWSAPHI